MRLWAIGPRENSRHSRSRNPPDPNGPTPVQGNAHAFSWATHPPKETDHRLFIGRYVPARLAVFATESVKIVASPAMVGHTDDLLFDMRKGRIHVLGEGFIASSMFGSRKTPITTTGSVRVPTPADARTGRLVPDLGELFETIPHDGGQGAEIDVYAILLIGDVLKVGYDLTLLRMFRHIRPRRKPSTPTHRRNDAMIRIRLFLLVRSNDTNRVWAPKSTDSGDGCCSSISCRPILPTFE